MDAVSPRFLASFACCFTAQPVAFAADLHDVGMVQQTLQHGGRECGIVGEGTSPLGEWQVAGENHAAPFVALGSLAHKRSQPAYIVIIKHHLARLALLIQ